MRTSPVNDSWTSVTAFHPDFLPEEQQEAAVLSLSVTGRGRSCGFSTSARGDDRAQLPVEEELEMKTNCFQAYFHVKH